MVLGEKPYASKNLSKSCLIWLVLMLVMSYIDLSIRAFFGHSTITTLVIIGSAFQKNRRQEGVGIA